MALFQRKHPVDPNAPPKPKTMGKRERGRIWKLAVEAAKKAASECRPTPMIVSQHANVLDDRSPVVKQWKANDGVCGFAWVRMTGTSAMGRYLSSKGIARPAYPNGVSVHASVIAPKVGQSLERGEAACRAAVAVLGEHGIEAWTESRID